MPPAKMEHRYKFLDWPILAPQIAQDQISGTLNLSNMRMDQNEAIILAEAMAINTTITRLRLGDNSVNNVVRVEPVLQSILDLLFFPPRSSNLSPLLASLRPNLARRVPNTLPRLLKRTRP